MAWEQTPDVYALPEVRLVAPGVKWLFNAAVSAFSLERELVASTIPGNIRSGNGLSVGSAGVTVIPAQRATPWSKDPAHLVTSGAASRIVAVDSAGDELPLGSWVVDDTAGALSGIGVDVNLLEAQYAGKQQPQALPAYAADPFNPDSPVDPVWAIARLAETAGFTAVPPPVESALLAFPMDGSFMATTGYPIYEVGGLTPGWTTLPDGTVGGESDTMAQAVSTAGTGGTPIKDRLATGQYVYFTQNVAGTFHFADFVGGWQIKIVNDFDTGTHTLGICNNVSSTFATVPFTPALDPNWPLRVQVRVSRTWNETTGQWTAIRANARSSATAAWSAQASPSSQSFTPSTTGIELIYPYAGTLTPSGPNPSLPPGQFSGIQVTTEDDPALWLAPKALLKPLGGDMGLPWVPAGMNAWTAIQDICSAWAAAAILGADGILRILTRDDLAGANDDGEDTDIGHEWTDLPWTLDPADQVDRVQVSFNAPTVLKADAGSTTLAPEAWRADDVVRVPAGERIEIEAQLENRAAVGIFQRFYIPIGSPDPYWSQRNTIIAFNNPNGTGSPLGGDSFQAQAWQTSATTARIVVINPKANDIYLVDGNGEPSLILRARSVATYDTPQIVERGTSAEEAQRPLEVDLAQWVQRRQDAADIADYLYARLSGTGLWKASEVRCRLDWSHDIGKVLRLKYSRSGLEAKALITKVSYDGSEGEIGQMLDLVLLPFTWGDWDRINETRTWDDWDAVWAGKTWDDFDANPLELGA